MTSAHRSETSIERRAPCAAARQAPPQPRWRSSTSLARVLVAHGLLGAAQAMAAQAEAAHLGCPLSDVLRARGYVTPEDLRHGQALWLDTRVSDLRDTVPALALMRLTTPRAWLRAGMVPLAQRPDGRVEMATDDPENFAARLAELPAVFHTAHPVIAPLTRIDALLAQINRPALTCAAAARTPEAESCRGWGRTTSACGLH